MRSCIDIGISIGYLYLMMGVIISSAVLPATLTLMWKKQNMLAGKAPVLLSGLSYLRCLLNIATLSPIFGLASSLIAWLVTAKRESGNLSVASTGSNVRLHPIFPYLISYQSNC